MTEVRRFGVALELHDLSRVNGRCDRGNAAIGEDVDVNYAVRIECRYGASRGRAETDHRGAQAPSVGTRRSDDFHRVQYRAVTSHLVVLMEDMEFERTAGAP